MPSTQLHDWARDAGMAGASLSPDSLAQLIAHMMDDDHEGARSLLSRAAALLEPAGAPIIAKATTPARGGLARWQIRKVLEHIDANLELMIRVADLAAITRLSPSYFCRAFKKSLGDTPHGYIMRKRIDRSRRLMVSTEHGLAEIAAACGLTDQAHLSRLFLRFVGQSPAAWRRDQLDLA